MEHKITKNDDGTVTIKLTLTTKTGLEVTNKLTITSLDQQNFYSFTQTQKGTCR